MYDSGKIIAGLVVFVGLFTFPIWSSVGGDVNKPKPVIVKGERCVESAEYMRANHMQMLNDWRNSVVRDSERVYVSTDGATFDKSLSSMDKKSCMSCHSNKKEFCDSCHTYANVEPYCWTCHVEPKEKI